MSTLYTASSSLSHSLIFSSAISIFLFADTSLQILALLLLSNVTLYPHNLMISFPLYGICSCFSLLTFCHTRPRGKTYPIPKGSKDGPKSGIIFISDQPASQPASQPPGPPNFSKYSKWNSSSTLGRIFLKF